MTHPHAAKLEEIEKRLNAATRGPWRTDGWVPTWAYIPVKDARHNTVCSMYPDAGHNYTHAEVAANAVLIANTPTDIRFLLDIARQAIIGVEDVRDAERERCAGIFDARAAAHKEAWNNCASDGHRNASVWRDKMSEAQSAAAAISALQGKPITRKEAP